MQLSLVWLLSLSANCLGSCSITLNPIHVPLLLQAARADHLAAKAAYGYAAGPVLGYAAAVPAYGHGLGLRGYGW